MEEKIKVAQNMRKYGGSFAAALAEALILADAKNTQKIKEAFPQLWEQYLNW